MRDIQPLLLHCDMLSAAQEALYLPDIFFSSQRQSAPLLIEDKGHVELPEEFVDPVPQEHRLQPKVRPAGEWGWGGRAGADGRLSPKAALLMLHSTFAGGLCFCISRACLVTS